jgi:hypothetical protein
MSNRKIGALLAGAAVAVALAPALPASAAGTTAAAQCDMTAAKPYRSGSTVLASVRAYGCTGRPSLTASITRDGVVRSSTSSYGPWSITLSTSCAAGQHLYSVSLKNNDNGAGVSNSAWITC